ncbi:MAG: sugar ABC transporter permease [Pseudomonadales bacterium]|nr:sugar ABC transporter permease [Pseudomonadales bacterium]NRA18250.1 sugar ABC transporter permease [Oceanospirillaceae bacterium]
MTNENSAYSKSGNAVSRILKASELDTRMLAMVGILAAVWLGLNFATDGIFLTARNLYNLSVQSSVVGIMATGMVLVIVARHIDLSVGSIVGFTGMMIAWLQVDIFPITASWNWPFTIVIGLLLGVVIGALQGYWIAYKAIPAFVVTLGGLLIYRGAAFLVTDGRTVAPMNTDYQLLGGGINGSIGATWSLLLGIIAIISVAILMYRSHKNRVNHGFVAKPMGIQIGLFIISAALILGFVWIMNSYNKPRSDIARGIPIPVLILIVTVIVMSMLTRLTRFGRYVFAIGGNPEAAELSGIDVKKVTMMIFALMGLLCGIAAVITTARLNAGVNSMGLLTELSVIAAAVIGGTSLNGGSGSITGAILGALIMQSLENGMVLLGAGSAERQVIIGLVLIGAVWFDTFYKAQQK